MNKTIYTFWEPKEKMPSYLQYCIATWKKYLSEYNIIVLDYSNIDEYLGKNFFDKCLYKKFTLATQADAIRCAILYKYGGIWLDCDTIITSNKINKILDIKSDLILFGRHIGFIVANKNSKIITKWLKEIKHRLFIYKHFRFFFRLADKDYNKKCRNWDFLGNGCLDKYLENSHCSDFYEIDRIQAYALPEFNFYGQEADDLCKIYRDFYFENNYVDYALDNSCGVILLHNSRTPEIYQTLDKDKFISQDNTLANIFKRILE